MNMGDSVTEFTQFLIKNYKYSEENYPLSKNINSIIPLNLFQTWHTKELPSEMQTCVGNLKLQNPEFNHYLYDDDDCRDFLKNNYSIEIVNAFDKIIPGAYKSDLWRLCVLNKYGGIYLDIKYLCNNNFKLVELTDNEHYCFSQAWVDFEHNHHGIYNAILISKPDNEFLQKSISKIVENVNDEYYGFNSLYPTGPGLLGLLYPAKKDSILNDKKFDLFFYDNSKIIYKNYCILTIYPEYRKEQKHNELLPHYSVLWRMKKIYRK